MKSYGVTIQMKPREQYFHMVLFTINLYLGFALHFDLRHSWESKG